MAGTNLNWLILKSLFSPPLAHGIIWFLDFIEAVLCATSTLGLTPPHTNAYWPKVDKLCRSEVVDLYLVEGHTYVTLPGLFGWH